MSEYYILFYFLHSDYSTQHITWLYNCTVKKRKFSNSFVKESWESRDLSIANMKTAKKKCLSFTVTLKDGNSGALREMVPKEDKVEKVGKVVLLATQPWRWKNIVNISVRANL